MTDQMPLMQTARSIAHRLREGWSRRVLAGGSVCDFLRGVAPKDIDIASDARPEHVQSYSRARTQSARIRRHRCPPQFDREGMLKLLPPEESLPLVLSVLFDDIGQAATFSVDEKGRIRCHGGHRLSSSRRAVLP